MTEAVVATYNDVTTVRNVEDDLRATGIPMEEIRIDNDNFKVRVTIPSVTKAEVLEILKRHKPAEVH
jgi:vancomycin permeability regulator SanA